MSQLLFNQYISLPINQKYHQELIFYFACLIKLNLIQHQNFRNLDIFNLQIIKVLITS